MECNLKNQSAQTEMKAIQNQVEDYHMFNSKTKQAFTRFVTRQERTEKDQLYIEEKWKPLYILYTE
jgi:hypothetical protein